MSFAASQATTRPRGEISKLRKKNPSVRCHEAPFALRGPDGRSTPSNALPTFLPFSFHLVAATNCNLRPKLRQPRPPRHGWRELRVSLLSLVNFRIKSREELLPEKCFALAQLRASAPCAWASVCCCNQRLTSSMNACQADRGIQPGMCVQIGSILAPNGQLLGLSANHLFGTLPFRSIFRQTVNAVAGP